MEGNAEYNDFLFDILGGCNGCGKIGGLRENEAEGSIFSTANKGWAQGLSLAGKVGALLECKQRG